MKTTFRDEAMALRLELRPNEKIVINGAVIRNGSRRSEFLVETHCKFLRGSEIISDEEADTPCKRLYVILQVIHLADESFEAETIFARQAALIVRAAPSLGYVIARIHEELEGRQTYAAIKLGKELIKLERNLLDI